jgi:hypothetical protein
MVIKYFKKYSLQHSIFGLSIILVLILWLILLIWSIPHVAHVTVGDYQREMAIVLNILHGNYWGHPAYLGEQGCYPILFHTIYAIIIKITHIPVQTFFANYYGLNTGISIVLIIISTWILYKSLPVLAFVLIAVLFVFPGTLHMSTSFHPLVLGLGTAALALMLFYQAQIHNKIIHWVIAGIGISIAIYAHPAVTLTVCGTIVIYQLITRKNWLKFLLMIAVAIIITSPYMFPMYKYLLFRKMVNPVDIPSDTFADLTVTANYLLYGVGILKWLTCYFIIVGLITGLKRHQKVDILICTFFLFTGIWTWIHLAIVKHLIPQIIPITAINDIQSINSLAAAYMFAFGLDKVISQFTRLFTKKRVLIHSVIYLTLVSIYVGCSLPFYIHEIVIFRTQMQSKNASDKNSAFEIEWGLVTDWINSHSSIYDVFVAGDYYEYAYIQGFTGRKVVASFQAQSYNPFVNYADRYMADRTMIETNDVQLFQKLAKKYHIQYLILTADEKNNFTVGNPKYLNQKLFTPVLTTPSITIYKYNSKF